MRLTLIVSLILLAGCATPTADIKSPPGWCMRTSTKPADLKEGDNLIDEYAKLKRVNSEDTSKIRCLQRYSRAVSNT